MNSFLNALIERKNAGFIPVIPDIKCISPKEGNLLRGRDPAAAADLLADAGAPVLSVVTESKHFGGSLDLLKHILQRTRLPVLRKDFISSSEDLKVTREYGAAAVLLICSIQPFRELVRLYEEALKIGLEPLIEVHTKEEMDWACKLDAKLVGINNRNILELEKDDGNVSLTELLSAYAPKNALLISESSIKTPAEAKLAIRAGAGAVLVGTALWQARDLQKSYMAFSKGLDDDAE